jgi:cupin fold WbuC family metalloprotein
MKIIDTQLLDSVSGQAKQSPRLRMNYNFHQSPTDMVQRMLNAMEPGTYLRPHRHPDREEVFLILRGKMTLFIFDDTGNVLEHIRLCHQEGIYGIEIPKMAWHTLFINEPDTVMYELKRGPYEPLSEEHFAPWSPHPNESPDVEAYLKILETVLTEAVKNSCHR